MSHSQAKLAALVLSAVSTSFCEERNLDIEKMEKREVRHSMIGYRNTLLFYTFKGQAAILAISIGNQDETFPLTGKLHLFPESTTDEDLAKWVNNQHSDGLFVDIPTPAFSKEIPEKSGKIISSKQTGTSDNTGRAGGKFKDFEVKFEISSLEADGKFKMAEFSDTAKVHVKAN
ncbi:MAG: hypothetical protein P1U85_20915 [Verrucomicrobiales bacterium]|jgi:hypothetical protein|nr:hypothetical protein [Verrucomicrobiales bacterium]